MQSYASPSQHPATSVSPPKPLQPSQLRTPVPPSRQGSLPARRARHGLGRPSSWALAVAALLVGLLLGLVGAGTGVSLAELQSLLTSGLSGAWSPG